MTDFDDAIAQRLRALEAQVEHARAVGRALRQLGEEPRDPAVTRAAVRRLARELLAEVDAT